MKNLVVLKAVIIIIFLCPVSEALSSGITVTPTSGLTTTELGWSDDFRVVLDTQPTGDVSINLYSGDLTEGTVSPTSLMFTTVNWSIPQTVTVTGGQSGDGYDGDVMYTIRTEAAISTDGDYNGMNPADVSVTNTNIDGVSVVILGPTGGLTTTESGGTATFRTVLSTTPSTDVLLNLSSSDTTEGTVSPTSLTFTAGNWDIPQTVTITGVDDAIADGDISFTIVTSSATSADAGFDGFNPPDIAVTNTNDDTQAIPTLNEWGMIILSFLLVMSCIVTMRNKKRAS